MFDATENDPISPSMRTLLEVFSTDLSEVKFPDVDSEILEEAAAKVRAQAEAVARAQAALEAARQALADGQDALLQKGQRALAYARVFAEEDIDLSMKVEAITLPKRGARSEAVTETASQNDDTSPRRRGRPPKSRPSAPLFADGSSPEAAASAEPAAAPAPTRPPPPVPVRSAEAA